MADVQPEVEAVEMAAQSLPVALIINYGSGPPPRPRRNERGNRENIETEADKRREEKQSEEMRFVVRTGILLFRSGRQSNKTKSRQPIPYSNIILRHTYITSFIIELFIK